MNTPEIILTVIGCVVALVALAPLFVKNEYVIRRDIVINEPVEKMFAYLRQLKNQTLYNKWVMQDPDLKQEYRGTDGTPGFVVAWEGNKQAGKGEQEIVKIVENRRIDMELRFEKPFKNTARAAIITSPEGPATRVEWLLEGRNKYPMNLMNAFISKMLRADLDESLQHLKTLKEKEISAPA